MGNDVVSTILPQLPEPLRREPGERADIVIAVLLYVLS